MSAGSNVVSVAEHVIMLILSLVRNYLPAHKQITDGGWDIGAAASKAYDLENKVVGVVGTGRIGQLVLARLKVSPPALSSLVMPGPHACVSLQNKGRDRKRAPSSLMCSCLRTAMTLLPPCGLPAQVQDAAMLHQRCVFFSFLSVSRMSACSPCWSALHSCRTSSLRGLAPEQPGLGL